ncbi:SulP family inorganic anion transporter [Desulfobacterales bacterium HSG2]|nr:SulP family inorganic anion transporter [Desulfobacterales bacterium HSG2]
MHPNTDKKFPARKLFPFLTWFEEFSLSTFQSDALAGLTVAVVLIPQAMAYAMLAGVPPVYGLYAAAVTPFVGALWGSLRQLATGPIAIMSLLVFTTLSPLAAPGSPEFTELAFLLAFMVGVLYMGIGLFRLGEAMAFISHSAVRGFTAGAAIIIISTQIPHFMGLTLSRHEYLFSMAWEILTKLPELHLPTLGTGIAAYIIIDGLKRYRPHFPSGLVALILTSGAIIMFRPYLNDVAVVGKIPGGLPGLHIPAFDFGTISSLSGSAMVMALVSFAETYSVSKAISSETGQKTDVNQEFVGQGLANLVGSFFQSYPVSGSFSRSAVNYSAGGKTGVSSVISSMIVALSLLFFTPLFAYIPKAALAALVINAVLKLFHPKEVFALWKMNRDDGIVAISVFVLAVLTKPDYALLIGVIISLIFFLWRTMHPRIVRMTKDPKFNMFVNADLHNVPGCPQILHLRSDNIIFFANAEYTIEHMFEYIDKQETPLKFLLLDFQAIGFIDITATDELRVLRDELKERGIRLAFTDVHLPVKEVLKKSGFLDEPDSGPVFENKAKAVYLIFEQIDRDYCKNICPHCLFYECSNIKKILSVGKSVT